MKTTIQITGQPNGNSRLARAIENYICEVKRAGFGNYNIIFKTKRDAKKAMWEAYQWLKNAEPEFAKGGISYSKYGVLRYDASKAEMI